MSDLIDRDALKKAIEKVYACDWDYIEKYFHIAKAVNSLPSVELERKIGHWIDTDNYYQRWKCSECGYHTRDAEPNYCPDCGAKMEWSL